MKNCVVLGAGSMAGFALDILNGKNIRVSAFGDNDPKLHGTRLRGIPVMPVADALALCPDIAFISVANGERGVELESQAVRLAFAGEIARLDSLLDMFDVRAASIARLAKRLRAINAAGSMAEVGVYRGENARLLNSLFSERRLYLFDTFNGFDGRDVSVEIGTDAREGDFSDADANAVLASMPNANNVIIRQGWFPDTAVGISDRFFLVSLDADLYAPTFAALEFFVPKMVRGGAIVLHDYDNPRFSGVGRALRDFEAAHGYLSAMPLADAHGSCVIMT